MTNSITTLRRDANGGRRSLIPALALVAIVIGGTAGCVAPTDPRGADSSRVDTHQSIESTPTRGELTAILRRSRA